MAFANTLGAGLSGARIGAKFGGPLGAFIGGGLGAGIGGLEDLFGGAGKNRQLNTLRPNQMGLQDSLISLIQSRLNGQGGLTPQSQNAVNRFNTQTVPSLAERFTSLGSGSQGSSAFTGALGNAGAGLQQELAGMDMDYIMRLLGPALGQSSENVMTEPGGFGASSSSSLQLLPLLLAMQGQKGQNNNQGIDNSVLGNDFFSNLYRNNVNTGYSNNRLGGGPF